MTDQWLTSFEERRKEREQADRSFVLLGETLTVKPSVAPQVGIRLNAARATAISDLVAAQAARDKGQDVPAPGITDEQMLEIAEETIRALIEPSSLEGWERLRSADNPAPLTFREIFELCDYLIARASGIPTDALAGSSNGQSAGKRSSKAASSSKAAGSKV